MPDLKRALALVPRESKINPLRLRKHAVAELYRKKRQLSRWLYELRHTIWLSDPICNAGDMIIVGEEIIRLGKTRDNIEFRGCERFS